MAEQILPVFSTYHTESSAELLLREIQDSLTNRESKNLHSRKEELRETAVSHLGYGTDKIQLSPCKQSCRHKNKNDDVLPQKELLIWEKSKSIYLTFTFQRASKSPHFGKDSCVNNQQLN